MTRRWLAPVLTMAALALVSQAALAKDEIIFEFSSDANGLKEGGPTTNATRDIKLRPNTGQAFYLYARNRYKDKLAVVVEITTEDGRTVLARSEFALAQSPANLANPKAVLLKLAKPAPPMPAGAAPAPMPPAAAAPMPPAPAPAIPPPPPGAEIKTNADGNFVFRVRAYDNRASGMDIDKETATEDFKVNVIVSEPTDYIERDEIVYRKKGPQTELTAKFKATAKFIEGPPCPVELVFPPQPALIVTALHEGIFRRDVTSSKDLVPLYTKNLPLRAGASGNGTFYVHVDGVPRAFVYSHAFFKDTEGEGARIVESTEPDIRFMEAGRPAAPAATEKIVTRPRVLPIRVEADTTRPEPRFELRILREGEMTPVETVRRSSIRDRRLWIDAGAMEGGMLVNAQMGDWIIPLNLRDYRGKYKLEAELFFKDMPAEKHYVFDRTLVVDDTKPEAIKLEILPGLTPKEGLPRHLRTKPLPVRVTATDPESDITRVVVFFGRPGPDGKLPEGVVEAVKDGKGGWVAQIPLPAAPPMPPPVVVPPEQKGVVDVTAVAVNAVGLNEQVSVRIQLIDPPTGGTIKGVVAMSPAGKGLPGVAVTLRDAADGKEKGATKTNDKGQFIFEDVPPGTYRVLSARPDSGVGTKGFEDVRVQAGKTSEVKVILTRKP